MNTFYQGQEELENLVWNYKAGNNIKNIRKQIPK